MDCMFVSRNDEDYVSQNSFWNEDYVSQNSFWNEDYVSQNSFWNDEDYVSQNSFWNDGGYRPFIYLVRKFKFSYINVHNYLKENIVLGFFCQ
jgi:hypothetical protein